MIIAMMLWMIVVKSFNIMMFNSEVALTFNDLPQLIIVMFKITDKSFTMVFFNIVGIVMVWGFYNNIMVPGFMAFMIEVVPHWIALISPLLSLFTRGIERLWCIRISVRGHIASRRHVSTIFLSFLKSSLCSFLKICLSLLCNLHGSHLCFLLFLKLLFSKLLIILLFVNSILHWVVLTLDFKFSFFLTTLHLLFSLLPHNLLLLLAEFQFLRRLIGTTHTIIIGHVIHSILWWGIRIIAWLGIWSSRERRSHWMALPWIIRLRTLLTTLRTLCSSFVLTTKDWLLCLSGYRKQCNQCKLHYCSIIIII